MSNDWSAHWTTTFTPGIFTGNPFLHLLTSAGRVDVLLAPDGMPEGYARLADCTGQAMIAGVGVALASVDDLITMKQAVDRPKDVEDLRRLLVLRERLIESQSADDQSGT